MYAIRPPEYFPGLPFWALMLCCDRFLLAESFQYSRQTFQNRARIRNPTGWQWLTVPLKGGQHGRAIRDVEIDNTVPWRGKHFRALTFNYRTTPYFEFYEERFAGLYAQDWPRLGALTTASIRFVADLFSLPQPQILSGSDDDAIGPEGDEVLLESDASDLPGVRLRFVEPEYQQNFDGFQPGMSIVDLLFNHGPDAKNVLRSGIVYPPDTRNNGSLS